MVSVAESTTQQPIRDALREGIASISADQVVRFTKYVKRILPIDGYVFWLAGESMDVAGSFHYSTNNEQREDETISVSRVVFNTINEIANFNEIDPQTMWVATFDSIRFAFSTRGPFYVQAGLFHYGGEAVYPALASQLVSNLYTLAEAQPIVSNSLPAWLMVQTYSPIWLQPANPGIPLYPSFLVPGNIAPPYGVVHIEPGRTVALQSAPRFNGTMSHFQLAMDHVKVTLYGYTNAQAQDWVDTVNQYSLDTDAIGMMNMPILRDEKRQQPEISALAMKKTIEFDVSYYQTRINTLARQLILSCIPQYTVAPYPVAA